VTSWFKNEVERMGFDTQNAWRISDINSRFRYGDLSHEWALNTFAPGAPGQIPPGSVKITIITQAMLE
jgi:hypothetical protein